MGCLLLVYCKLVEAVSVVGGALNAHELHIAGGHGTELVGLAQVLECLVVLLHHGHGIAEV